MSRIINLESVGKERNHLVRTIILAVRELAKQSRPSDEAHDLAAYIALSLQTIGNTIDVSVLAWEKRGYWVKADRFRMDWQWTGSDGNKMREAIIADDWMTIAQIATHIAEKLNTITIPNGHRMGRPWIGAWKILQVSNK